MTEPDTHTAPTMEAGTMSVLKPDIIAILSVGVALGLLMLTTTGRIESQIAGTNARLDSAIAEAAAERRAFEAQAAADRRASDAKMDEFRAQAAADRRASKTEMDEFRKRMDEFRSDMQQLGEHQARLEGQREAGASR